MKVFKVLIENHTPVSVVEADDLEHGEVGFKADNKTIQWLTLECPDKKTAFEVAEKVVHMIWRKNAA